MPDEHDVSFDEWYAGLNIFDITDAMTFRQALSKAYFAGAVYGMKLSQDILAEGRQTNELATR